MHIGEACKQEGMPNEDVIFLWAIDSEEIFGELTRAQELWCLYQSKKIIEIADDQSRDQQPYSRYNSKTGELIEEGTKSDNTAVNRDALRIKTRSYLMSRWMNRLFGEKSQMELSGKDGGPLIAVVHEAENKKA